MVEPLLYDEIELNKSIHLEDILNTPDGSDIGFFVEIDLRYPDNKK